MSFSGERWLAVAFGAFGILYLAFLIGRTDAEGRLYWEQSGRLLGKPYVEGFVGWVQRRVGPEPKSADQATRPKRALAPYTEFPSEYPPGALIFFSFVRLFFDSPQSFRTAFGIFMAGCVIVATLALYLSVTSSERGDRRFALCAAGLAVWVVLTGSFAVTRFDPLVMLAAALGLLAYSRMRVLLAAVCFGLGGAIKIWPLLLVPAVALAQMSGSQCPGPAFRQAGGVLLVALIAFAVPHVVMLFLGTAPLDLFQYLSYLGARPPQIESVIGNIAAIGSLLGGMAVESVFDYGSNNVVFSGWQFAALAMFALFAIVYLVLLGFMARAPGNFMSFTHACGLIIVSLILFSKVFSGEYLIWFYPIFVFAIMRGSWLIASAYCASLVALKFSYWNFTSVLALEPGGTTWVAIKNLFCLMLAVILARALVADRIKVSK